jgi:hypothetical protein
MSFMDALAPDMKDEAGRRWDRFRVQYEVSFVLLCMERVSRETIKKSCPHESAKEPFGSKRYRRRLLTRVTPSVA